MKGNDLYRNMTYDREKMQYIKPGEVCDFGVKKGCNSMNEKYEFMHGGVVATTAINNTVKAVDTDDIAKLIAERDKARLDYVDVLRREHENEQKAKKAKTIENVIFNPPDTIVFWADGTKTVVKCQSDGLSEVEPFDPEKGLAMAFMKKMLGNKGNYYNIVDKWVHPYWQDEYDKDMKKGSDNMTTKYDIGDVVMVPATVANIHVNHKKNIYYDFCKVAGGDLTTLTNISEESIIDSLDEYYNPTTELHHKRA